MVEVDPLEIRFTHASISSTFRSGDALDDIIIAALNDGPSVMTPFPPMELVNTESGKIYSISNRRLFVFRCLANAGVVKMVRAVMYPQTHARLHQIRFETRLRRFATKWERSFSTCCDGEFVEVDSTFMQDQFSKCFLISFVPHSYVPAASYKQAELEPPEAQSPSDHAAITALWNPSSLRYGTLDATGKVFTKTKREGAMKLIYESMLRQGGRHSYRVKILQGQLAASDGIGFVFSDRLGNDIQGIQSMFVNRWGSLVKRFADRTMVRTKANSSSAMAVGMLLDLDVDLDAGVAVVHVKQPGSDWNRLPVWDLSDVILTHRKGYFCVAFSHAVTVQLESP